MNQLEPSKNSVNEAIQPRTEKEAYVWKACSALYFDDELPFKAITQRRILAKRGLLEEGVSNKTKGDNSGLSEMKVRWAAHHGIDPKNDPNQSTVNPVGVGEDPLLRASKLVREQLLEELEQQYQGVIDTATQKTLRLEEEINQLKTEYAELSTSYDAAKTQLEDIKPQHTKALEQIISLQATVDTLTNTNQGLQHAIEQLNHHMEQSWQRRLKSELENKEQRILHLTEQTQRLQSEITTTRDGLQEINENQRHQAMMDIEQLKDKVTLLQSTLDSKLEIEVQRARIHELNTHLTAQLAEMKSQYTEQQALVVSLQEQLSQQASQLQAAAQQNDIESLLTSQFGEQAQLIEHLTKNLLANKEDKLSKKKGKSLDTAVHSVTESE